MGEIRTIIETRAGRKIRKMAEDLDKTAEIVVQGLAKDLELVYQSVSPKGRDTRLARGIVARRTGTLKFEIISTAKDPLTGYPYTGVTRFGHRKIEIKPKARSAATVVGSRQLRARGRRAVLRITLPSGEVIFRLKVKGYRPVGDWAEEGHPIAERQVHVAATTLGNRVITRFS